MPQAILLFLVMVAAGYLFRRLGWVRPEAARDFNRFVLYLALPMLIFRALRATPLSWSFAVLPVLGWAAIGLGLLVAWGLGAAWKLEPRRRAAFGLLMAFGNTTFLGYPLIAAIYGEAHLSRAIFFDQLGGWIAANTVGVMLASGAGGQRVGPGAALRTLLTFPPFWALVLGLLLHDATLPAALTTVVGRIADLTVPLIMFAMGLSLRGGAWRHEARLVAVACAVKLLLLPLAMYAAARGLSLARPDLQTAVFQAAMPGMFYTWTLAQVYELDETLVINGIMASTFLAVLTVPLWVQLLG